MARTPRPAAASRTSRGPLSHKFRRRGSGGGGRLLPSRCCFIASVSSSSHDRFIANPFSVRRINHAACCRGRARLCSSVDYKRGALEIPLNSEEVLITHSALIPFSHIACRVTCDARRGPMKRQMIETVGTESENTTACAQRRGFPASVSNFKRYISGSFVQKARR